MGCWNIGQYLEEKTIIESGRLVFEKSFALSSTG